MFFNRTLFNCSCFSEGIDSNIYRMMINFCSFEEERLKLVEKALSWFNESDTRVVKFVVGRDTLKIPRSIKIFSPFLSDLIGSLPVKNDDLIIIIPDCSSTSFKHLVIFSPQVILKTAMI